MVVISTLGAGKRVGCDRGSLALDDYSAVSSVLPTPGLEFAAVERFVDGLVVIEDGGGVGCDLEDEVELVLDVVGREVAVPTVGYPVVAGVAFWALAGDGVSAPEVSVGPD